MDQADIPSLLSRLNSDEDAMRKMAVFKLQSSINDPAFADLFISSGGLTILRRLIMSTGGNTLAYSLQSLTRLLEVDMGWEIFESAPEKKDKESTVNGTRTEELAEGGSGNARKGSRKHNPEKWRRLGFETESPAWEFDPTGFLGMMDLTDYVRKEEDNFQKMLLEQSTRPLHERCPIATASLACTAILYEHFEVEKSDVEDAKSYLVLDGMKNYDKIFRPLLLQWSRLHTASLHAFFRLWKSTGAEREDFDKVAELVRILIDQVVGLAPRTKDMLEIEEELSEFEYSRLREMQMELLELSFEDEWGQHLHQVRDELKHEALQFVKEQRIRCLLSGAWFPRTTLKPTIENPRPWRYIKLSHNRRYLHYADFDTQTTQNPTLDALLDKIDLSTISSVISNVSATDESSSISSTSTLKTTSHSHAPPHVRVARWAAHAAESDADYGGDESAGGTRGRVWTEDPTAEC
ncbi:putative Engulfment and cell motility protein 3 [Glarea lozoyensis 74030]|uniref:Putative Engulfment and cell motility protein 3 n=1 Tax=Glarea lozoyensis (strain ATCC 74030 / MF5533) TaxID=1104152 RepID=H0ERH4_GLAL7|nr:putative Engulfment and cell motility protein 3 [Glarea lozoyensis 74030]